MTDYEQWSLLDILNILSFIIGVLNYQENLTQNDKNDLMTALDNKTNAILTEIHEHLKLQDDKINQVLKKLEGVQNDS